jgi:hypothetical protein
MAGEVQILINGVGRHAQAALGRGTQSNWLGSFPLLAAPRLSDLQ